MARHGWRSRAFALALLAAGEGVAGGSASAAEITPHLAVYGLKLGATRGANPFTGAEGSVVRAVERTCDGWVSAEQSRLVIATQPGGEITQEVRFTGWESTDGKSYRFAIRTKNNAGEERVKGEATLNAEGGSGEAKFDSPEETTKSLPDGTFFPIGQMRELLKQAEAGKRFIQFAAFDGTDVASADEMSGFVGKKLPPGAVSAGESDKEGLTQGEGWRMSLAFFEPGERQATPTYEVAADMLANGVIGKMIIDFDEFQLIQELQSVEPLPEPSC